MSEIAGIYVEMIALCRCRRWHAEIKDKRRGGLLLMVCIRCGTPRAYVSAATEKWLLEIVRLFGRPDEPIIFAKALPVPVDSGLEVDQQSNLNEED
jgi:hypothetical protein